MASSVFFVEKKQAWLAPVTPLNYRGPKKKHPGTLSIRTASINRPPSTVVVSVVRSLIHAILRPRTTTTVFNGPSKAGWLHTSGFALSLTHALSLNWLLPRQRETALPFSYVSFVTTYDADFDFGKKCDSNLINSVPGMM
uniref:Uncharacterized protein n=1 Tax=Panagrellus redivivus TaxID=6233 RepID=A0A7E4UPC8_PANRE